MPLPASQVIDLIFKDPNVVHSLIEFQDLGRPIDQILEIVERPISGGKHAGKPAYYVKSLIATRSGRSEYYVYSATGKSAPEEIVRQLWLYKLIHHYGYAQEQLDIEVTVHFGTQVSPKAADIVVYTDRSRSDVKIIVECKQPKSAEGIEQLKSYMSSKGAPTAVWSNGTERVILFRSRKGNFDDTLPDIPSSGQTPQDVLEAPITVSDLRETFNFKRVVQDLEELVLADSGADEFNEIFKLIFAKIWDERSASATASQRTRFRKDADPSRTYDTINGLFKEACIEWPGIFDDDNSIELAPRHLQICIGPVEKLRLMGSNLRIMDDAFEYLLPSEAKKKKGQFFTPRPVIEMCVRMLNPKSSEYVMDPACGSGGFLVHTMDWVKNSPSATTTQSDYASRYLWGIDFEKRAAKTSRALMLIAGDGHTNIFGPDVNSIDPRTWYDNTSGRELINRLVSRKLIATRVEPGESFSDRDRAWDYFGELKFDVILANPPFAGEIKDPDTLGHYELARPALARKQGRTQAKEERDVLFLERIIAMLKPGGRAAVVLPQGKLNNPSLAFIRTWLVENARLLGVIGLHQNTFKPHTGTKTSVLLIQKHSQEESDRIQQVRTDVAKSCPDFEQILSEILETGGGGSFESSLELPHPLHDVFREAFPEELDLTEFEDEEGVELPRDEIVRETKRLAGNAEREIERIDIELAQLASSLPDFSDAGLKSESAVKTAQKEWLRASRAELRSRRKAAQTQWASKNELLKVIAIDEAKQSSLRQARIFLETESLIEAARQRWISDETVRELDYPVFMAVSERGGKDSSGNYIYQYDDSDATRRDAVGHGLVDQDLVNFELNRKDLADIENVEDYDLKIAEQFIRFARAQKFDFWAD